MTAQAFTPNPTLTVRRVVTGHDADGRSVIADDGTAPINTAVYHEDFIISEVWRSDVLPADNAVGGEACRANDLEPSSEGNLFRIVRFPPDSEYLGGIDVESGFASLGKSGAESSAGYEGAPHPLMHRTSTVDYIVVISGEIYAVMEKGEVLLQQGDVLVQRGTNHAWSNRSNAPCVIAAILNAAQPLSLG